MARFSEVLEDVTKLGTKIPQEEYLSEGLYQIIDQGQSEIAGYTNKSEGLYSDVPVIIFGDHTRVIKYVDRPLFLGADGVKLLRARDKDANYKYLFYALCSAKIPNTGYNRHFKWLKEIDIPMPSSEEQRRIAAVLDKVSDLIALRKQQLAKLDELVKARFVEMFGDPVSNPLGWEKKSLKETCTVVTGNTPSRSVPEYYGDSVEWIKTDNIVAGQLYPSQAIPPMDDQKRFASFVAQVDKSKSVVQSSLDKLEMLNSALMQEYFG